MHIYYNLFIYTIEQKVVNLILLSWAFWQRHTMRLT